jgi:hypothetical protein
MSQKTDAQLITEATVIKTETALGANTANRVGTMFVDSIDSKVNVDVIDANVALGSSNSLIPTQNAVKTYADGLVVGLVDDRGNFTPSATSPGGYPTTGGSGTSGAIKKGDLWFIDAVGYLSTTPVVIGTSVRALTDAPGQTAANWNILNAGLGFTPENVLNKSTATALGTSNTLYPSQNAVKSYVDTNAVSKTAPNTINGNNTFNGECAFNGQLIVQGISVENELVIGESVVTTIRLGSELGTSGQVLTSQGGAATPTWETPTPGISPADNTTFTGDITFAQNTEFTTGITTPLASTSVINGTIDLNYIVRANGSTGTAGQVLTSNGAAVPTWQNAGAGGGGVTTVKVTLTSADILATYGIIPFELIAAPGVGKMLNVYRIRYIYNFNTEPFGSTFLYCRTGAINVANNISNLINASQTQIGIPSMYIGVTIASFSYENQALNLYSLNQVFTGDGSLDVYITYDTITL